jgi:hypothetical protein
LTIHIQLFGAVAKRWPEAEALDLLHEQHEKKGVEIPLETGKKCQNV